MNEPTTTREEMLKFLRESDIRDSRVMGAMATVPREDNPNPNPNPKPNPKPNPNPTPDLNPKPKPKPNPTW